MHTYFVPSIGPDVSHPRFQKKNPNFVYFFLLIQNLWDKIIVENDFWLDIGLIVFGFAVILQLFGTFSNTLFYPLPKLVLCLA